MHAIFMVITYYIIIPCKFLEELEVAKRKVDEFSWFWVWMPIQPVVRRLPQT